MSGRHVKPTCVYCGSNPGETRDHVPPKALFAKPRPTLITVPCCHQCRETQSLDDEYFVRMILMRRELPQNSLAIAARDAVLRSLTKPNKQAFTRSLVRTLNRVPTYTPSGIYVGHRTTYTVDLRRLDNVIQRTTRALYFQEFGAFLPSDHICITYAIDAFSAVEPKAILDVRRLWTHASSGTRRDFGDGIFTYWFQKFEESKDATHWAFLVYGCTPFVSLTCPATDDPRPQRARPTKLLSR